MTDRYSKLARAILVPKIAALHVAVVVLEDCIITYSGPRTIITRKALQFVSNFFTLLCAVVGTKLITTVEYYPQAIE